MAHVVNSDASHLSINQAFLVRLRTWFVGLPWPQIAELGVIGLWALWVGRNYLNLNPSIWPEGGEWGSHLVPYYFWPHLRECGMCALWSGDIGGGMPALGTWFGSTLHPLAAIFALLFGVTNGIKLAMVAAFWLAGVAQWWMASSLGLGRIARLWSSLMVIVGGHLAVVMEPGVAALIIATSSASLVIAATLALIVHGGQRRYTLLLAILGAFFILAGHAYLQFGMLWWAFALPFLILDGNFHFKPIWKEFALAVGLSVCLTAILLIPSLHFSSNFFKPGDATFGAGQTLEYLPLNLVIRDWGYLHTEILGKLPYSPTMFVGWLPIILAVFCLKVARPRDNQLLLFLTSGSLLMLFVASGTPLRWLVDYIPEIAIFRSVVLISGLAVPGILALAAYGLHYLIRSLSATKLILNFGSTTNNLSGPLRGLSAEWFVLPFLAWALFISYQFSAEFLKVQSFQDLYDTVQQIPKAEGLQWIQFPLGEISWLPVGMDLGLKQTVPPVPYNWEDRPQPEAKLFLARLDSLDGSDQVAAMSSINLFQNKLGEYARVELPDGQQIPCTATGQGAYLEVVCDVPSAGKLVVQENTISDWKVWRDNESVPLLNTNQWLSADAPAGHHTYQFRYQPWDVTLGAIVSLASLIIWVVLWQNAPKSQQLANNCQPEPASQTNKENSPD